MIDELNADIYGGKAASLVWLKANGFNPPNFIILPYRELNRNLDMRHIAQLIARLESALVSNNDSSDFFDTRSMIINFIAEKLRDEIRNTPLDIEIINKISHAWKSGFFGTTVAVRSSAKTEDSLRGSSAGQYETALGISSLSDLLGAVREIQSSYFTIRAIRYRSAHGLTHALEMSVVIQEMIPALISGIAFSKNPITRESYDSVVINASWGLGDLIVGGEVQPDEYVIDVRKSQILAKHRGTKQKIHTVDTQHNKRVEQKRSNTEYCLNDEEAINLAKLINDLEKRIGYPVDVEWVATSEDDSLKFRFLQARPITTL